VRTTHGLATWFFLGVSKGGASCPGRLFFASLALIPVSLIPGAFGRTGLVYFVAACILSSGFFYYSARLAFLRSNLAARQLLKASIVYLPLAFVLMIGAHR
jgi:heme o synthase